jgi:hypothetical protein
MSKQDNDALDLLMIGCIIAVLLAVIYTYTRT